MVLDIINVSARVESVAGGRLGAALERLAQELERAGPPEGERIVFLPPLLANLAALRPGDLGSHGVASAVRLAALRRLGRAGLVGFTYPGAGLAKLPWLTQHDRVHEALRRDVGGFAARLGAAVVGPTALLDHPRVHWEAWPDTGALFHSAWTFGPDGEPASVVRHPLPSRWSLLAGTGADKYDPSEPSHLQTPGARVAVHWDDDPRLEPGPEVVWLPRAWVAPTATRAAFGRGTTPQRRYGQPAAQLARAPTARVVVRSCLAGRLGPDELHGDSVLAWRERGLIRVCRTPDPGDAGRLAWSRQTLRLSSAEEAGLSS